MRWLLFALGACGRVAFDARATPDGAAPDVAIDASPSSAPLVQKAIALTGGASQTLAFPTATTPGNLLVAVVGTLTSATAIVDTAGDAFVQIVDFANPDDNSFVFVWHAQAMGGPTSVTVSFAGTDSHSVALLEYAGYAAFEGSKLGSGIGTALDTGPLQTGAANDLLVSFTHQPTVTTWTAPAGLTVELDNQHTLVADSFSTFQGAYHATLTSAVSQPWDMGIVGFAPK